ncbi:ATP-binding protein [Robbsia andropogonis]|uniref:Iron-sulfur cluster carrier protein n=1 Tax=Robbsia andropogonis TaxID=28092 RepID=A0A0F5K6G4_9BURK|nr:iron-sulfur cluster carrier protein ApbC [Robbsia andropogonis]KKB65117.1 ATP-binding protein [Robbsia andropogonis]MCP1116501.1 iron-sulfur cluster carrier protein ApbC [Robbsia andropogonis]MCP1126820.1 iron-sulfur cluster carrier protein ApbC [Robbsia andropogonis]
MVNQQIVEAAVAAVLDPYTGAPLGAAKAVRDVVVTPERITLRVTVGYPSVSAAPTLRARVEDAVRAAIRTAGGADGQDGASPDVQVAIDHKIVAHAVQRGVKLLPNVKNIIAVASGKGGVGKSTTAANIALALVADGARVGVLDADIYGPSQPLLLGISGQPETTDGKSMEPMTGHGLQVNSIGFLVAQDNPMVWRGPMVSSALDQLLNQTNWQDLDYLIVDMPPGTGDIQLTLAQKVPVTGAVIVTTPQDLALLDARKGLKMFEKVGIPILGIVENMSIHVCSNCGHAEPIFGSGGAERMCGDYNVDFLGALPLDIAIRQQADAGVPTVVAAPDGAIAGAYRDIARRIAVSVAAKHRDMSAKFPTIVVQNS